MTQTAARPTPGKTIPFRIQSMQQASRERYLKLLIYGAYGVGKTVLSASACEVPTLRDVLLLSCESGDLSVEDQKNLDVVRATSFSQAARIHEFLKLHCQLRDENNVDKLREVEAKVFDKDISEIEEPRRYRTVIVDSLSELETYSMYSILGISDRMALDQEVAVAEWADFRRNFNAVQRLVRSYRDLPANVIFTCSEQYSQDDQKRMTFSPLLTGKLSAQVQGFVDVVGHLQMSVVEGKTIRRLYVQPVGRFAAKCRFRGFKDPYFEAPTIGGMLKAVGLSD